MLGTWCNKQNVDKTSNLNKQHERPVESCLGGSLSTLLTLIFMKKNLQSAAVTSLLTSRLLAVKVKRL